MQIKKRIINDFLLWALCIIVTIILSLIIKYYVIVPTTVKQISMYPTLESNQKVLLNRLIRLSNDYQRGDIVTFEAPNMDYIQNTELELENPVARYEKNIEGLINNFIYYVLETNKTSYIKRIIGLPGEHIKIENNKVYINGKQLEEPYLADSIKTTKLDGIFYDIVIPEGTFFLMGDNRENSTDSRQFGCIPINKIEGKVWIRFWPLEASIIVQ